MAQTAAEIETAIASRRYLLGEITRWQHDERIAAALAERLAQPYQRDLAVAEVYTTSRVFTGVRLGPPECHQGARFDTQRYCPHCGDDLVEFRARPGAKQPVEPEVPRLLEVVRPPVIEITNTPRVYGPIEQPLSVYGPIEQPFSMYGPIEQPLSVYEPTKQPLSVYGPTEHLLSAATVHALPRPSTNPATPQNPATPTTPASAIRAVGKFVRELRPVFYENLILLLGAFLVVAGSVYFAIYFWDRLGAYGPVLAGSLLGTYALSFVGAGYLLQRRYRADFSARVLYSIGVGLLPVAFTLAGQPLGAGAMAVSVVGGMCVLILAALCYPATVVASALFQREMGFPLGRMFCALLLLIGFAPLVTRLDARAVSLAYLYLATLPLLAMYRRVRDVGRVFEKSTVVFVVGGSAYVLLAVAVRLALAMNGGLAAAEVAPLLVLLAAASIDLDVQWRQRTSTSKSTLGVVGVIAHAVTLLALMLSLPQPAWRVFTFAAAGLVFSVTAIRHNRAVVLHLGIASLVVAGLATLPWLLGSDASTVASFAGLVALPLGLALTKLAGRWRRGGAEEFAQVCELWASAIPALAAVAALLLPWLGASWQLGYFGQWALYAPALIVLPVASITLALQYRWEPGRFYLAGATVWAAITPLVALHALGAGGAGVTSAAALFAIAISANPWARGESKHRVQALIDAAVIMVVIAVGVLGVTRLGPWHDGNVFVSAIVYAALALAAAMTAGRRPRAELGMVVVLALSVGFCAALWSLVPHALLPSLLGLALLALHYTCGARLVGKATPFASAYAVALVALCAAVLHLCSHALSPASVPPLEPLLIGLALVAEAARRGSPWPSYGAFALFVFAGFGLPNALQIPIEPRMAAKLCGVAMVIAALALRLVPRLRPWRRAFLDIPLHLAALVAPIYLVRLMVSLASAIGSPEAGTRVLRHALSPLGAAALVMVTHGSRLHGYIAAIAFVVLGPALVVAFGLDHSVMPAALVAMAIGSWLIALHIDTNTWAARTVAGRPLRLLERWQLPSLPTYRELVIRPLSHVGAIAAVVAFSVGVAAAMSSWPIGAVTTLVMLAGVAVYAFVRYIKPINGDALPLTHVFALATWVAVAFAAVESAHIFGIELRSEPAVLLGVGFYVIGSLLARGKRSASVLAQAAFESSVALLFIGVAAWVVGAVEFGWPWSPTTPAVGALLAALLIRPGAALLPRWSPVANLHAFVALGSAAGYLALAGARWQPSALLCMAAAVWGLAWIVNAKAGVLSRWARAELPDLSVGGRVWAQSMAWLVGALFAHHCASLALGFLPPSVGIDLVSSAALLVIAGVFLVKRRGYRDWALPMTGLVALAWTLAPVFSLGFATTLLIAGAGCQLFAVLSERRSWFSDIERRALGHVVFCGSLAFATMAVCVNQAGLHGPWAATAALIAAVALARLGGQYKQWWLTTSTSVAAVASVALAGLWAVTASNLIEPLGLALSVVAAVMAMAAWAHWLLRRRLPHNPTSLASFWAGASALVAVVATFSASPAGASTIAPIVALGAIMVVTGWFAFLSYRTGRGGYGYLAQASLILAYIGLRASVLSGLDAQADAVTAIAFAFGLHFLADLLRRSEQSALGRTATTGARLLPLVACVVVAWSAVVGHMFPTMQHVVLAEAIAVLYTLAFRGGGHRSLGVVAMVFCNAGLALLWLHTGRMDALYYTIPLGASIVVLARVYAANLSANARRGLRSAGCLLIYFSTYYQAVQFTNGVYPLLLGGLALVGVGLGYWLRLRDLFFVSTGFLVLNVMSNLTYYGVHKPVIGWTLLTAAGLLLTAGGVLVQIRRSEFHGMLGRARTAVAGWE